MSGCFNCFIIFSEDIARLSKPTFLPHYQHHILVLLSDLIIGVSTVFYEINLNRFAYFFSLLNPLDFSVKLNHCFLNFPPKAETVGISDRGQPPVVS